MSESIGIIAGSGQFPRLVDTFITEVSQDTWILFPWDSEVQYTAPLVEQN